MLIRTDSGDVVHQHQVTTIDAVPSKKEAAKALLCVIGFLEDGSRTVSERAIIEKAISTLQKVINTRY